MEDQDVNILNLIDEGNFNPSSLDIDIKKNLINGYKTKKYTHTDIVYMFGSIKRKHLKEVVKAIAKIMYDDRENAVKIYNFIEHYNRFNRDGFSKDSHIDPVKFFISSEDEFLLNIFYMANSHIENIIYTKY